MPNPRNSTFDELALEEPQASTLVSTPLLRSHYILGLRVDECNYSSIIKHIQHLIESGGKYQLVLPNVEFCIAALHDPEFRQLVNTCALSIPDGRGLHLAMRFAGCIMRDCTTGTDLGYALAEWCSRNGRSMFLYGGKPGVAEAAAEKLQLRFPMLKIAGTMHGYQTSSTEDREAIRTINRAAPEILIVCKGMKRQEFWIRDHLPELNIRIAFGNGGAIDFWSERIQRAPRWMQRAGLEWLFRLLLEPQRWRRQLALPYFAARFAWAYLMGRSFAPPKR